MTESNTKSSIATEETSASDAHEEINSEESSKEKFRNVMKDFLSDILNTFPELQSKMHAGAGDILMGTKHDWSDIEDYNHYSINMVLISVLFYFII